jgi:hypothetical protein
MLKKSASGVLASLRGSTLRQTSSEIGNTRGAFSVCQELLRRANGYTKCGPYLLASSLAATLPAERRVLARRGWEGENRGLFEHPELLQH